MQMLLHINFTCFYSLFEESKTNRKLIEENFTIDLRYIVE